MPRPSLRGALLVLGLVGSALVPLASGVAQAQPTLQPAYFLFQHTTGYAGPCSSLTALIGEPVIVGWKDPETAKPTKYVRQHVYQGMEGSVNKFEEQAFGNGARYFACWNSAWVYRYYGLNKFGRTISEQLNCNPRYPHCMPTGTATRGSWYVGWQAPESACGNTASCAPLPPGAGGTGESVPAETAPPVPPPVSGGGTTGDITGDGKADVLAVNPAGDLYIHPGNGQALGASYWAGNGWGTDWAALNVADLTGDGKADVIAASITGDLYLYPSNGTAFGTRTWLGNGWSGAGGWAAIVAGDVTGDGKADIVAKATSGDLYLYPSNGQALGSRTWLGNGWTGMDLNAGDVTGDGKADIVAMTTSGDLYLYPSNGQALGARSWLGNGWTMATSLDFGDVTADGKADAVLISGSGDMYLYPSNGQALGASTWLGNGWQTWRVGR
ncbi:FG-GAP repeat domain-containing protein [Actinokineospora sp. HUAS TT18]|uniref:FG-GAP repeat domain-containing protein n=1 Tax=Actinokineospora sp. HUAS TT18 TaxID=3447451 RepID=UPI003F51F733